LNAEVTGKSSRVLDVVEEVYRAGSVGEEHPNRHDLVVFLQNRLILLLIPSLEDLDVLQLRDVLARIVVESDPSLFDELKGGNGSYELRATVELENRVLVHRFGLRVCRKFFDSDGRGGKTAVAS